VRFLMVTTFFPPYNFGGDGAYVHRLSNELARRGHEVHVVHCKDAFFAKQRTPPSNNVVSHPNVTVHSLASGVGFLSPLSTQQTGRAFFKGRTVRQLVREVDFDVLHFHNMSLMGLDTLRIADAIKLYTIHEHWLVCPTHVLFRYNRELCTKQTCITCQLVAGRPPQLWRYTPFLRDSVAEIDRFLCPSRFTMEKHRELGFEGPMTYLPYFLSREEERKAVYSEQSPHPRPYALFVGRLEKIKGVQNLIEIFRGYNGCDLVVIGDGGYQAELKELARDLPHVRFLGRLPYEAIRSWYRHALAVIVPSICYEVFGIVLLEAFVAGAPTLVPPLGALPEVVIESGGGVVYHSDEQLISTLERLRRQPGYRADLGARGHEAYIKLWSEDPHIDRYMDIIRELQAETSGAGGASG
jgi:glycosyltransferase involved in cell wall biosynthesis